MSSSTSWWSGSPIKIRNSRPWPAGPWRCESGAARQSNKNCLEPGYQSRIGLWEPQNMIHVALARKCFTPNLFLWMEEWWMVSGKLWQTRNPASKSSLVRAHSKRAYVPEIAMYWSRQQAHDISSCSPMPPNESTLDKKLCWTCIPFHTSSSRAVVIWDGPVGQIFWKVPRAFLTWQAETCHTYIISSDVLQWHTSLKTYYIILLWYYVLLTDEHV